MAYGNILADVVQSSTTGTAPVFKDGNSVEVGTLCRAWVNFNPNTGSIVINGSLNVSSVTYNSTGSYRVNFTNAFADTNYVTNITASTYSGSGGANSDYLTSVTTGEPSGNYGNYSTTNVGMTIKSYNNGLTNPKVVSVAIFR